MHILTIPAVLPRMRWLFTILTCCLATDAMAAAWTQEEGKTLLITTAGYYGAEKLWTNNGTKASQPRYQKGEFSPYLEYGYYDWLTLGGTMYFQHTTQSGFSNTSMGDTELFARMRLWQKDGFVVSIAPQLKLPTPFSTSDQPVIGSEHPDAGMQLSGGYGFDAFGQHHYIALDAAYRYRFGMPKDQLRLDATLGIGVAPKWTLMPQLFVTRRVDEPTVATFTQSSGDDYNVTTLQISTIYDVTSDLALQVGGYKNLDGKNVGSGSGGLIAVWKRF